MSKRDTKFCLMAGVGSTLVIVILFMLLKSAASLFTTNSTWIAIVILALLYLFGCMIADDKLN